MSTQRCPACGNRGVSVFYERAGVPAHSCLLLDSPEAAISFPRGDLRLGLCDTCGFVHNADFDEALSNYSPDYEETQAFSPHFRSFIAELAKRWVDRYSLEGKRVVEIGCGKGEFLTALAEQGVAEAVGIDPGVHPERIPEHVRDRVSVIQGFFPRDLPVIDADAVVCRHTLEHIGPVRDFLVDVRRSLEGRPDAVLLFELPESLRVFRDAAFWDVYYEHCSYFTERSLVHLFRDIGLDVLDVWTAYGDQYILLEAGAGGLRPTAHVSLQDADGSELAAAVQPFAAAERDQITRWIDEVDRHQGRVVLWGSGSKGVAFLAALGTAATAVECVVDINPNKWGRFMAGSGHPIVGPDSLRETEPDLVIVMNPVYLGEISACLGELGLTPKLLALENPRS